MSCVFCDIVAGREQATIRRELDWSLVIEPLEPVTDGHVLVLPERHVNDAHENPAVTGRTMHEASAWASAESDQDERYWSVNFITSVGKPATQSVFHLHIHIVPRRENDGLALPWYSGRRRSA